MAERPLSTVSNSSQARAAAIPLPSDGDGSSFREPQAAFLDSRPVSSTGLRDSVLADSTGLRDSVLADSTTALGVKPEVPFAGDGENGGEAPPPAQSSKRRLLLVIFGLLLALVIVVLAVMLPVYFKVIKPNQRNGSSDNSGGSDDSPSKPTTEPSPTSSVPAPAPTTGGDGSEITTEDGSTFIYSNTFGGLWYADPDDPYNDNARPNSWTPPLNEKFDHGTNKIFGVNLGGLFVLEPFISPAIFQRFPGTRDEWELSLALTADTANGGLDQLEEHYKTFITEQDIAEIAGAGLNWVRLPVPYWAIETWPGEPFLARTSWKYIVRVLQWCRKYGLRVNLDLHTVPGSHNAYNHGGKIEVLNFLNGAMGMANAQRALYYIRVFTEFINQPEWRNVVPMFSILNEPVPRLGAPLLRAFYVETHRMMREVTGFGEGNGPYMVIHDSFQGLASFSGFMRGADRVAYDVHPYFAFNGAADAPTINSGVGPGAGNGWAGRACSRFATMMNDSRVASGVSVAGEFSLAWQDCGLFLRGVGGSPDYSGDCTPWLDSSGWSDGVKAGLLSFASAQMDNLEDYFFWTWKIGQSSRGIVEAPFWSYSLGLKGGWLPTDPRTVIGTCEALGHPTAPFSGYAPWMTGGAGAGAPTGTDGYPWPPQAMADGNPVAALPTYTSTGTPVILPNPTFTDSRGNPISGGSQEGYPAPTPILGCTFYVDAWDAESAGAPGACV